MTRLLVLTVAILCLAGCAPQPERSVAIIFAEPVDNPTEEESELYFDSESRIISSSGTLAKRVASVVGYSNHTALSSRVSVDSHPKNKGLIISVTEMPGEVNSLEIAKTYAEQYRIWHKEINTIQIHEVVRTTSDDPLGKRVSESPAIYVREVIITNNLYPVIERIILDDGTQVWPITSDEGGTIGP